jgi:hypothetical protein
MWRQPQHGHVDAVRVLVEVGAEVEAFYCEGINRLISPKSSHRRDRFTLRHGRRTWRW